MTFSEMADWLGGELAAQRISESQVADVLAQRILFDQSRAMIEQEYRGRVVGYVANNRLDEDSTRQLIDTAIHKAPGRMLYFESVGRGLFS